MKAIVLSCDRYHPMTDHMIQSYRRIWPSHPFSFRVPYQEYPNDLKSKYGDSLELVRTPVHIKQTVLTLIEDLPDEEWIYWCVDDKYLVSIDETAANHCYSWISQVTDPSVCGASFCRARKLLDPKNLRQDSFIVNTFGETYIERKNYFQIWIPQFLRVTILRDLFLEFPDRPFKAKEMDVFTGQEPDMKVKELRAEQKLFVSEVNYARFEESTSSGFITRNCHVSMTRQGLDTSGFEVLSTSLSIGEMNSE